MDHATVTQLLPYLAWLIGLTQLILGLYILILNAWHPSNRHIAVLMLLCALYSFGLASLLNSKDATTAALPASILAMTSYALIPLQFLCAISLLSPGWLRNRWKWIWWPVYALVFLPSVLTFLDLAFEKNIWITPVRINSYRADYLFIEDFATGSLSLMIQPFHYLVPFIFTLGLLLYFAIFNRNSSHAHRKLAWILLIALIPAFYTRHQASQFLNPALGFLLASSITAFAYGFTCIYHMVAQQRVQRGSLQFRLTALILMITVPMLVTTTIFITSRAERLIEQYSLNQLRTSNQLMTARVSLWIDGNVRALQELVVQPDIVSMDSIRQKPVLEAMAANYPQFTLVSTLDLEGMNVARSDHASQKSYRSEKWFQDVISGKPLSMDTLIDPISGHPSLIVARPISNQFGEIVGAGMFVTRLAAIDGLIQDARLLRRGEIFVLNEKNQVIASSETTTVEKLEPMSVDLSLSAARQVLELGESDSSGINHGMMHVLTDSKGGLWRAYSSVIDNGWSIIVKIPDKALLADLILFKRASWLVIVFGASILLFLSWLTIRHGLKPLSTLTQTAENIAEGDLTQFVSYESEDEIGKLSRAFNSMTGQLRELITNLEKRVGDRTRELERRAIQLEVTAEVAREAASIQNLELLMENVVQLVSKRFNFYHAGLFLLDDSKKYAVLQAASSPGGHKMIARGHKLEVGVLGIVGYVAGTGEPRIALDVGEDAVYFDNPDLPQTRSEIALPLLARGEIIGVLDVQSTKPGAFTDLDTSTLQVLADQVALAIENAKLINDMQDTLLELQRLYELQIGQAWQKRLGNQKIAYSFNNQGVKQSDDINIDQPSDSQDDGEIDIPIVFRGYSIGSVQLQKEGDSDSWTSEEIDIINAIVSQFTLALENARLLEETQRRADRETFLAEITAKMRSSNDISTILDIAAQELREALRVKHTRILLNPDLVVEDRPDGGNGHPSKEYEDYD